jgi:hypothetical protein
MPNPIFTVFERLQTNHPQRYPQLLWKTRFDLDPLASGQFNSTAFGWRRVTTSIGRLLLPGEPF